MRSRFLSPSAGHARFRWSGRGSAAALGILLVALAGSAGCGEGSDAKVAARILDRYRKVSGAKPLPAGGMIRIRLSPAAGAGAEGQTEIVWEPWKFRETVSSAGLTTVRGIESDRGYFTDGDGVTRVASEPVLRELLTRSYFWRRAWLFEDREKSRIWLGPADDRTVSLRFAPLGGDPLRLTFSRDDGALRAVDAPRFHLAFSAPDAYRDASRIGLPVSGRIVWTGLPTGPIPHAEVGGGRARFPSVSADVPIERMASGSVVAAAAVSGKPVRLALDASVDGPLRLTPALAARLPLPFVRDVFGREIAAGASLEIGGVVWPSLFVERSEAVPGGADASAGGAIFREAVVELDLRAARLGLHDPARWATPDGFYRLITDDDGDRPVVVLKRGSEPLRLTAGVTMAGVALAVAAEPAERAGLDAAGDAEGLTWGPMDLPPLSWRLAREGHAPDWGDDGALGFAFFDGLHAFINMPQRWTYARPSQAGAAGP